MPKQISDIELEVIKLAVGRFSGGASIDEINGLLEQDIHRRTLQRRLAFLVAKNELILEGAGRGSRYRLTPVRLFPESAALTTKGFEPLVEVYIPISKQGEQIKQSVRLPVQQRKPVGYNRKFLDAYQPNKTFYLPDKTRQHLMQIGQSQADALPAGTYVLKIYNRLLIDLTWNSSRLEGNTYSLLETERLLAVGETADGKSALETQMILNHKAAIELLVDSSPDVGFNRYTLCNLHALLSENLLPDPAACGRLREHAVGVGGSVFHPLEDSSLIDEYFDKILIRAHAIQNPFEQVFFSMVQLPYLQPFDDVNKRVSRLVTNIPLIRENLSPLSFIDLPEKAYIDGLLGVYELNQTELLADVFVWAYERSCARYSAVRQSLGQPDPFRLQYREQIAKLVAAVVAGGLDKRKAVVAIKKFSNEHIAERDQPRFIEMVETELMSLHQGNIAKYRLRPSEFEVWKNQWN